MLKSLLRQNNIRRIAKCGHFTQKLTLKFAQLLSVCANFVKIGVVLLERSQRQ